MEEKRRDAVSQPAASSAGAEPPPPQLPPQQPVSEPGSSRRRAGGNKRKSNSLNLSNSQSAPSKRLTREKALISHLQIHNGPLTRARQGPSNLGSAAAGGNLAYGVKTEAAARQSAKLEEAVDEELNKASEEWEALEAKIEAEFDAIRSRDSNAHVVPTHCGWFSWTKTHPLEERTLPSFFDGKSDARSPDMYMEIRNWIMKKFHANPNTQIELKDLSELEVGDLDARQEVMEFLDYWGLINFHPLLPTESAPANADADREAKNESLLENLYRFEAVPSCLPVISKPNLTAPTVPSGLFPESAIAEELVRPGGPDVEYHCNSCSADCSRKRYHCQKQADFDLCSDCFNNGKFGSGMSSSDFILMEPAEAPGVSGGKWTDQETLLLLEALELYKENWNEIAEHVATKTKAQCILHFVQMPIEDIFLDCDDEINPSSKETQDPATINDDASVPKDVPETTESKNDANEAQPQTSPMETSKPEDVGEVKVGQETSKPEDASEVKVGQEISKSEDTSEAKVGQETGEDIALKALREAFKAVGYLPAPEGPLSFAEVGNPVMALAVFLTQLVGPDIATASARSSLKSVSGNAHAMQLAARHCFLLEDSPDAKKETIGSESVVAEVADRDAQKDENQEDGNHKEDNSTSELVDRDTSNVHGDKKVEDSIPEENTPSVSPNSESIEKLDAAKEPGNVVTHEEKEPGNLNESSNPELPKDHQSSNVQEADDLTSNVSPSSVKESGEGTSVGEPSQPIEAVKDTDMLSDSVPSEKIEPSQPVRLESVEEPSEPAEASKDVDMVSDSLPQEKSEDQQLKTSSSKEEPSQPTETSKDIDMVSDLVPSEMNEPPQPVTSNPVVENGATTGQDQIKDSEKDKRDCTETKDDHDIDRVKRAVVSALSAASVKAKLLANQEEDQIRLLTTSLIEKQLHKLETKLAFFNEMESVVMRVREQLDRSRQRLYHERAQIIAARLGLPASSSRAMPSSLPSNRIATNFANSIQRPPMSMTSQRPPILRPMGTMAPTPSNPLVPTTTAGSSIRPSSQDKLSSVLTK